MTLNEVKIVIDNIDDFIEIPEGISQLRQAVLSLAVSGKLVPQDKKDGTAEELYSQNTKKIPDITPDEIPFEIPKSWRWIRLIDIADIYNGDSINKQIKESKYSDIDKGYPYIATKDINRESHMIDYLNGIKIPFSEKNFKIAPKDSVLICSEGGNAGRKIGILNKDVCFGNKLITTISNNKINSKFIFFTYIADYFQNSFQSKVNGLIGGISISNFKYLPIALPPLAEQKRIVNKLEELMKQFDELEIKKQKSDETRTRLSRSAMQSLGNGESKIAFENLIELIKTSDDIKEFEGALLSLAVSGKLVPQDKKDGTGEALFSQIKNELEKNNNNKHIRNNKNKIELPPITSDVVPFDVPKSWRIARLGEIAIQIKDGTHFTPKYIDKGVPFVSIKDISGGSLNFSNTKYISESEYVDLNKRCNPELNDILICRIGTLGKAVLVDTKKPFSLFVSVGLIKYPTSKILPKFLIKVFNSPWLYSQYEQIKAGGVATNKLNLKEMPRLIIPIPPLAEQKRIVEKIEEIMVFIDQLRDVVGGNKSQGRGRPKK